jgi:hypothetical protein
VRLTVRRRIFWPLIALASLCLVLAGGSFAAALFSSPLPQLPRRIATYAPTDTSIGYYVTGPEAFGRSVSLSWSSDRGFLIAAIIFGTVGIATFGLVARAR